MKEFMLIIYNTGDKLETLSVDVKKEFLRKVQTYIERLKNEGKLKNAQPLERQGRILSGTIGAIKDEPIPKSKEIIVGYYHIIANDVYEAMEIAKHNPEFEFTDSARIEIRPIKMKEELIDFVYF